MDSDLYEDSNPTQILSIAIRKRRELHESSEGDLYREILNRKLIQHLCRQLGQKRSRRHSRRRGGSRSRSASKRKMLDGDESETKRQRGSEGECNSNEFEIPAPSMVYQNVGSSEY